MLGYITDKKNSCFGKTCTHFGVKGKRDHDHFHFLFFLDRPTNSHTNRKSSARASIWLLMDLS